MTTEQTDSKARALIYRKIAMIAAAIQPVKPTGYNQDTKKKYADADDITAALKPLLGEHQLSITMHISQAKREDTGQRTSGGTPYILTSLDCVFIIADGETGELVICPWAAEAADHMKDKGIPKALTIARRTFLIHTFQIIAEEEKQLYGGQQEEQRPAQQRPPTQAPKPAQQAAPTNGKKPASAAEAQQLFFAHYQETIGGANWAAVQKYLGSRAPMPSTIEGWRAAAEAVRDQAKPKPNMQEEVPLP